jgi:hypothetical protein
MREKYRQKKVKNGSFGCRHGSQGGRDGAPAHVQVFKVQATEAN